MNEPTTATAATVTALITAGHASDRSAISKPISTGACSRYAAYATRAQRVSLMARWLSHRYANASSQTDPGHDQRGLGHIQGEGLPVPATETGCHLG